MNKGKFIVLLKDILYRAKKKGFPKTAGICSYFFLFYCEKKITMNEMDIYSDYFNQFRPTEVLFVDFYNHQSCRKTMNSDMWWFCNEQGNEQRIEFLGFLIKYLQDEE